MRTLRNYMNYILNALAGASFIAMVILTCWQVFTRYILKHPSSWSEELVSYLFAWMALLGASVVVGERGHMNISIAVERMGAGAQNAFAVFAECIACLFAGVILLYGGVQITSLAMGQMTSSLGVPAVSYTHLFVYRVQVGWQLWLVNCVLLTIAGDMVLCFLAAAMAARIRRFL